MPAIPTIDLSASSPEDTSELEFTAEAPTPGEAEAIAQEWAELYIERRQSFELADPRGGNLARYRCELFNRAESCKLGGEQSFRIRLYPCHPLLTHPLECGRMIWL